MTDYRSYRLTRAEEIRFYAGASIVSISLSLLLYHHVVFALILLPFLPRIRMLVAEQKLERRRRDYRMQFKDFLFIAATAVGAGRSMKDAIGESIPGLIDIYGDDALLVRELTNIYARIDQGNEDDIDVLADMALLSGMEDVIDFVAIYSSCKVTGANLITAMNQAASMIIDKMTIDREIHEMARRKELEGLIIFVIPIVILIFLNLCAPDYIAPMYETVLGRLIMTGVVAANIGIYEMIRRIVKVGV